MSTAARLSLAEYDRMIENAVFDEDRRIELINGEICDMSPIGSPHEDALDVLARWSFDNTDASGIRVRVQNSIGVPAFDSAPQPDLVWVVEKSYSSGRPQPKNVLLIIEVSDSSLHRDRTVKADLYAGAEIKDYWIVNIPERCIEVYRDPHQSRYRSMQTFRPGQEVQPLAASDLALPVALVFNV